MCLREAVDVFAKGYFSTCRRSEKTQAAYEVDLRQMLMHFGAELPLSKVTPDSLEEWARLMRSGGYASVSVRRKLATAKVFFAYWVRRGTIDASPFWKIRLDLGIGRVLPRSLDPADAKLMIEEAWRRCSRIPRRVYGSSDPRFLRVRDLAAIEVLFATGMRVGELVHLRLSDWNGDEARLLVTGKGSRQRLAFMPDERSKRAFRTYLMLRCSLTVEHDSLFVNSTGDPISEQGIARFVTSLARDAGVARHVTPHVIRHTVATLLLRYGADIRVVQEVLGHSSIATTQRYTHVSKEHLLSTLLARHPNLHLGIKVASAARGLS